MDKTWWLQPDYDEPPKVELDPNQERKKTYHPVYHNKVPTKHTNDGPEVQDFTEEEKEQQLYETNFILHQFHNNFRPSLKYTNVQYLVKNFDNRDICYCCQNLYLFEYTVSYHIYRKNDINYRICEYCIS